MQNENARKTTAIISSIILVGLLIMMNAEAATIKGDKLKALQKLLPVHAANCVKQEFPTSCIGKRYVFEFNSALSVGRWRTTTYYFDVVEVKGRGRDSGKRRFKIHGLRKTFNKTYAKPQRAIELGIKKGK